MDDREFDLEIENLLRAERKKEPYYLESLEKEQLAIVAAFYDHFASLSEMQGVVSVDDFLKSLEADQSEDQLEADEDFCAELNELIQKDIERYDELLQAEVQMNGSGLFIYYVDPQGESEDQDVVLEVDELEEGMSISGEVKHCVVAPMIPHETLVKWRDTDSYEGMGADDMVHEMPGLWLKLANVSVTDVNGMEVKTIDMVLVPMNYPSMTLHKIIRRGNSSEIYAAPQETKAPVTTHFKGEFIIGVFNDKENDLNYNDYTDEERRAVRESHQLEIGIYMSAVEQDELLELTAFNSFDAGGNEEGFAGKSATYIDSVFVKIGKKWRVIHAFLVETEDGPSLRHVLSEDIIDVRRKNEK